MFIGRDESCEMTYTHDGHQRRTWNFATLNSFFKNHYHRLPVFTPDYELFSSLEAAFSFTSTNAFCKHLFRHAWL